jgi:hypothetical protein
MSITDEPTKGRSTVPEILGEIDRLSLEQALRDFEIANARVIDLTRRLIEVTDERNALADEVARLRIETRASRTQIDSIAASRSYKLAVRLVDIRRLLRP